MTTTGTITSRTLEAPGATLAYDIRPAEATTEPILMLIGSPMAASGFGALADRFPDRTVVTYDPRGSERSSKDDPGSESTPEQHADDVHRVIQAVGGGPVDLFASSGGAVNALALIAKHPEDIHTLVAHEPPVAAILADREHALAAVRAVSNTYQHRGFGAGMAHFIAVTGHTGPFTAEAAAQPAPDPAAFGMPAQDDGSRTDALLAQNIITCTHYQPDFEALGAARAKIVLAAGEESAGQMANRGAYAVAERLGTTPVVFPSHHGGFVSPDSGWGGGQPDAFAAKLREVLTSHG